MQAMLAVFIFKKQHMFMKSIINSSHTRPCISYMFKFRILKNKGGLCMPVLSIYLSNLNLKSERKKRRLLGLKMTSQEPVVALKLNFK